LTVVVVLFTLLSPTGAAAGAPRPAPGPVEISGDIDGAAFRIVVPAGWNGTLLVYAHGYRDAADHPGEPEDRSAQLALTPATTDALLRRGFALAGTAYRANGWAVEEALEDVRALASRFRDTVARPARTILWSNSMGTVVTLQTAERTNGLFDGYLVGCTVGAGASRGVADGTVALRVAYDVAFGMPAAWGTPSDVRDDLDYQSEVRPKLLAEASTPDGFARTEFIRLVVGIPGSGVQASTGFFPAELAGPFYYATEAAAELDRRAGGPPGQNLDHTYRLTSDESGYLRSLGLDPDPLLVAMNARRTVSAAPGPRSYVERFADYTGTVKAPVVALHTIVDPVTPVSHESAYQATVAAAGREALLVQAYTRGAGHCRLTPEQIQAGMNALDSWLGTGTRPPTSAFPESLGFQPDVVPPAWPQP
jgi:hypothetical protein